MQSEIDQMLTARDVMNIIGVRSQTTLRDLIRRSGFPKPYEITKGKRHFSKSEVQAWLKQRMADQRQEG